jgi:ABC-type xylose transport system permease subunit
MNWRGGAVIGLTAAVAGAAWTSQALPLCATLPVSVAACVLLGLFVGLTREERQTLFAIRMSEVSQ